MEGPAKGHRPRLSQGKIAVLLVFLALSRLGRRFLNVLCFFHLLYNQAWYNAMVKVFTDCNVPIIDKLTQAAKDGSKVPVCCV